MGQISLDDFSGAEFSECGKYRYKLWRMWERSKPAVLFVMLNPSTADRLADDPTIRRCVRFAELWGYGSLHVGNAFAYRSPTPASLLAVRDAEDRLAAGGVENDQKIYELAKSADRVVVAWGKPLPALLPHVQFVSLNLLATCTCHCLGLTKDGHPRHPLYVPYVQPLQVWTGYKGQKKE